MPELPTLPPDYPQPSILQKYVMNDIHGVPTVYYNLKPGIELLRARQLLYSRIGQMDIEIKTLLKYKESSPLIDRIRRVKAADQALLDYLWAAGKTPRGGLLPAAFSAARFAGWALGWGALFYGIFALRSDLKRQMDSHLPPGSGGGWETLIDETFDHQIPMIVHRIPHEIEYYTAPGAGTWATGALRMETKAPLTPPSWLISISAHTPNPIYRFLTFGALTRVMHPTELIYIALNATINLTTAIAKPEISYRVGATPGPFWVNAVPYSRGGQWWPLHEQFPWYYYLSEFTLDLQQGQYYSAVLFDNPLDAANAYYPSLPAKPLQPTRFTLHLQGVATRPMRVDLERFTAVNYGPALPEIPWPAPQGT